MTKTKKILVFGATGQQGGSVVNALLKKNYQIKGVTRNDMSPAAKTLSERGVEIVSADFRDHSSLVGAVKGVDVVFAMTTPFEEGVQAETMQGVALIEAIKASNPVHVVFSSVANADKQTGIPHFDSKFEVEKYLAASGLPYTIVAPVFFMENVQAPWLLDNLKKGTLSMAIPASRTLQQVAVENIGEFAASIIERGEAVNGRRYDIAGDEISGEDAAAIISKASGKSISYTGVPPDLVRAQSEDMAIMYEWFDKTGYSTDIDALQADFPEIGWLDYEAWAREQDWSVLG